LCVDYWVENSGMKDVRWSADLAQVVAAAEGDIWEWAIECEGD
jgi:hypothetical protein